MHELDFVLLHANDDILFSYHFDVLDTFCQISGLSINMGKNKNDGNETKTLPKVYMQGRTNTSVTKLQISRY